MTAYRIPAERERFNPPPPKLPPVLAFKIGMRRPRWWTFGAAVVMGAVITTLLRYALGWREYDLKGALLNGSVLALVMFLIDMARGYRRAFCIRAGIRRVPIAKGGA